MERCWEHGKEPWDPCKLLGSFLSSYITGSFSSKAHLMKSDCDCSGYEEFRLCVIGLSNAVIVNINFGRLFHFCLQGWSIKKTWEQHNPCSEQNPWCRRHVHAVTAAPRRCVTEDCHIEAALANLMAPWAIRSVHQIAGRCATRRWTSWRPGR